MGWIGDEDDRRRREALRDADATGHGLRGGLVDGWSSLLHVLRTRPVLGISVVILTLAIFGIIVSGQFLVGLVLLVIGGVVLRWQLPPGR